jgi:hypothetical protein
VNPRLVRRLLAAIPIGFAAAGWGLHAGWHPLLIPLLYCGAGSVAIVILALVAVPLRNRPARDEESRLDGLLQPQST